MNRLPVPPGWRLGWKLVAKGRRPATVSICGSGGPALPDTYKRRKKSILANGDKVRYRKGCTVWAKDLRTNTRFKSVEELKKHREKINVLEGECGPGIHVYITSPYGYYRSHYDYERSGHLPVAYRRDEIVGRKVSRTIVVLKVKVLA